MAMSIVARMAEVAGATELLDISGAHIAERTLCIATSAVRDAENGEVLWETIVGGPISTSNITYAVNGRQYVAVITGNNLSHPGINTGTMGPLRLNIDNSPTSNGLYVFALPE